MVIQSVEDIINVPVEVYVEKILAKIPFSFLRFGDGEWFAVYQTRTHKTNCDGHRFFKEMGQELTECLTNPLPEPAIYGMQNMMLRKDKFRCPLLKWLKKHDVDIKWYESDVLHNANWDGNLGGFIHALKGHGNVVVIGPKFLRKLKLFPVKRFVPVPKRDCYLDRHRIMDEILDHEANHPGGVFLFSASMATEVMIYQMFPQIGKTATMIDCGSLWDVYVGKRSRKYHGEMTADIIFSNYGDTISYLKGLLQISMIIAITRAWLSNVKNLFIN